MSDFWRTKKVVVTGGAGFLGSWWLQVITGAQGIESPHLAWRYITVHRL